MKKIQYAGICLGIAMTCTGCSDSRQMKEDLRTAERMGHERAIELREDAKLDTMQIESALLDVRSRENRLRAGGHDRVADAYINSFLATLDSVNPSLAAELHD